MASKFKQHRVNTKSKLTELMRQEGYQSTDELLDDTSMLLDSVVPSICMNPTCDYTTGMEPDQYAGYCDICGTNSVKSVLILLGVI